VEANCEEDNCDGVLSGLKDLLLLDEYETVEEDRNISQYYHKI